MRGIKTGIGVGEAQVFDTSNIVNTFIKTYQLKQKEDQLFAEKIADQLSKFDTTGLTGKDLERANKMYEDLKGSYGSLYNLSGSKKALLDAEIRRRMNDIKTFSSNAKQFYKDKQDFAVEYNKDAYSFLPEVKPYVDKVTPLSYGEALDQNLGDINSMRMKRTPDMRLIDDSLNDFGKIVKSLSDDSKPTTFTQEGIVSEYRTANPKAVDASALAILTDDAKKFAWVDQFKRANPNVPPPTDEDLVAFIKKAYENKNGGTVNAYRFLTGSRQAQKPSEGKQPTEQEQYSGTLNNAFGTNPNTRAQAIDMIKSHSKGRLVDLIDNGDGTLTLIPYKTKSGVTFKGPAIPITSAGELNSQLGAIGVTQSGFGVIPKLNQGTTSTPFGGSQTPKPSSKTVVVIMPNGTEGEIPASQLGAFLKKYPGAKRK
jgi:hypothetical protein